MKSNNNAYAHMRPMTTAVNHGLQIANGAQYFPQPQQQQQQQLQQQAWHVTLQAIPTANAMNGYSDLGMQQHSGRSYPQFVPQQSHMQQQYLFYPEHLRSQLLKPHRHASPLSSDSMSFDAVPLEPKRRTRRRRRRPRKTELELAALVHIPDTSYSPTGLDQDSDDADVDADDAFVQTELQASNSSSSSSLYSAAALSASSSARASMEFEVPCSHTEMPACRDPWQPCPEDSFDCSLDACYGDLETVRDVPSVAMHLDSCTSQLLSSDNDIAAGSQLASTLKLALAWHAQLGDTPYFSGSFY
jgi:hypothetical protein